MRSRPRILAHAAALAGALSALVAFGVVAPSSGAASTRAAPTAPRWRVVVEPKAGYSFLDGAITRARRSVIVEMYELADPTFVADVIAASRRHVAVEVLLDRDYSAGYVNRPAFSTLSAHHVAVRWANSGSIFHEKALVVDGTTAYVGSGNLTAKYYATTRDFWVADPQRADVAAITSVFRADWAGGAPAPGPHGADLVWSPNAEPTFLALISHARRSITLESEELSDAYVIDALVAAARRHVAVHVTMTYSTEWRSAFRRLLAAGAAVHVFHGEHPVYIHAKALCVDCTTGARGTGTLVVGSQNLSYSSLAFNRELSIRTAARPLVAPIDAVLRGDFLAAPPYRP